MGPDITANADTRATASTRGSHMKVGDLVRWRGSIGLIVHEYSSKVDMVWVKWNKEPKRDLVEESYLEVISEVR